jgi:hypothetical protein
MKNQNNMTFLGDFYVCQTHFNLVGTDYLRVYDVSPQFKVTTHNANNGTGDTFPLII